MQVDPDTIFMTLMLVVLAMGILMMPTVKDEDHE